MTPIPSPSSFTITKGIASSTYMPKQHQEGSRRLSFKLKARNEKGSTEARAIYNVLGIDKYGHKDLLGMYVSHRLP